MSNLISIEKISSRVIVAEFNTNPITTFIVCYSPTNSCPEGEVDEFYQDLRSITENVPTHNFLTIAGDFNAQIGPEDALFTYNKQTNRNGEKLLELTEEFSLTIANTRFQKAQQKLWTWESPNGHKTQIDYILVRSKWKNSVRNAQAFSSFSSISSDHRVVSCTISLSLRKSKKPEISPFKQIDWKLVNSDSNIKSTFLVVTKNRFQELSVPDDTHISKYQKLIESTSEIAIKTLPRKKKRNKKPFSSHHIVIKARNDLNDTLKVNKKQNSRESRETIQNAHKQLENAYLTVQSEFIQTKIDHITSLHTSNRHAAAWSAISELSGRKSRSNVTIKGGSQEKRKENWKNHFQSLLGAQNETTNMPDIPLDHISAPLDIQTSVFSAKELEEAVKVLKLNKSPGLDNIPTVVWKDPFFQEILLDICNCTYITHNPHTSWLVSGIVPVPKKGDLSNPGNYRGISLIPIASKIYNRMLLNRIVPFVEPLLRKNQNGFRAGRSTLSQILSIRRIIEEMKNGNKSFTLCFVDLKKAFDSINREVMFKILSLYGIPEPIVEAIRTLYTNTKATVISPDGETEFFDILIGVLQGDTLGPFLFIIVLDNVLRISMDNNK